jgi:hypothetical protein
VARVFESADTTTKWVPRPSRILRRAGTGLPATSDLPAFTPLDSETKSLPILHSLARVLAGAKARISSCLIAALKRRSSTAIGMILRLASLAGRTKASVPSQSFWRAAHSIPTSRLANHGLGDAPQATLSACLGEIWGTSRLSPRFVRPHVSSPHVSSEQDTSSLSVRLEVYPQTEQQVL